MMGRKIFLKMGCIVLIFFMVLGSLTSTNSYAVRINENVEAPIELSKEIGKNQFLMNEEFTITYRLKPKPIPVDSIIPHTYAKDKEIVLVMDTSGSMDWNLNGENTINTAKKRITISKEAAKLFIDRFKDINNVKIGLVDYDRKGIIKTVNNRELVDKEKFGDLKKIINDELYAEGSTNIGDGLRRAYWILQRSTNTNSKKYIVLMTDGQPTALSYVSTFWSWKYKLGDGMVENNRILNYGDKDPRGYALEYAKTIASKRISSGNPAIDTFIIGFSNDANKDKLQQIAHSCDGFYKEAKTADDINEVYEKLADQIQSDLPIHSINFQETFPHGLDIVEVSKGLEIDGQTVTGDIGSITYILNKDRKQFEAKPLEFFIKLKGSHIGDYTLSVDDENNSLSSISYGDINGDSKDRLFPTIDISIYKDIIAPEVNIRVADANGMKDTYGVDSENEDIRVDKLLNPSIILRGDSFAQIGVKAKDVNFFEYQFIKTTETPQNMPNDNWKSINLNEETINDDVILDKKGYLNKRAYDVNHMPTLNDKEKWENPREVFKTPFDATKHMSGAYSTTPKQYGSWENYLKTHGSMGKRWSTKSIFMKNMNITWHNGNENNNYKEASKFWGYIKVPKDGNYRFGAYSDDGCRGYITVDGETNVFVNMFKIQGSTFGTKNKVFNMKADKYYPIYLEYFNWGGWAHYELTYSDDESRPQNRIPADWLYPSKNITPGEYATTIFTGSQGVKFPRESGDYYIAFRTGKDNDIAREGLYGPFTIDGNTPLNLSKGVESHGDRVQINEVFMLRYGIELQDIVPRGSFRDVNGSYKKKVYLRNVKIQDEYPQNIKIDKDLNDDGLVINGQKIRANIPDIEYRLIDKDGSKVYSAQTITLEVPLIANASGNYTLSGKGKSVISFDDFNESKPQLEFDPITINVEEGMPVKDATITDVNDKQRADIIKGGKLIIKVGFQLEREVEGLEIQLMGIDISKFDFKEIKLVNSTEGQIHSHWYIDNENNVINIKSGPKAGRYECLFELDANNPDNPVDEQDIYHIFINNIIVKNYHDSYSPVPNPDLEIKVVPEPKIL
ncbi:MAG: VWA domain-containing protein [Maledivibacter sp.]|jgi:hypothetical protein|nr:VWA domain-containing protein [Maledivibacter sp.]